jgi:hypothetical protein
MRTTLLYACLATVMFLGVGAGVALADGPGDHAPDQTAREERLAELREARNESLRMFQENRTAALQEYRAAHNATKASFLENKTRVIEECRELRNETEDANETAQCVRDGLKPLIEQARAEHRAQREALLERLLEARTEAKAAFLAARQAMRDG